MYGAYGKLQRRFDTSHKWRMNFLAAIDHREFRSTSSTKIASNQNRDDRASTMMTPNNSPLHVYRSRDGKSFAASAKTAWCEQHGKHSWRLFGFQVQRILFQWLHAPHHSLHEKIDFAAYPWLVIPDRRRLFRNSHLGRHFGIVAPTHMLLGILQTCAGFIMRPVVLKFVHALEWSRFLGTVVIIDDRRFVTLHFCFSCLPKG